MDMAAALEKAKEKMLSLLFAVCGSMAPLQEAKEKMLLLHSSHNQEFEVNKSVAMQSTMLKKMIKDGCADKGIPLPNITSHVLGKVIEYCNKHAEPIGPRDAESAEDVLKIFDADFVIVELDTLIDLMLVANYLDIKGLLNLTHQTITDMVLWKMPEVVPQGQNLEKVKHHLNNVILQENAEGGRIPCLSCDVARNRNGSVDYVCSSKRMQKAWSPSRTTIVGYS